MFVDVITSRFPTIFTVLLVKSRNSNFFLWPLAARAAAGYNAPPFCDAPDFLARLLVQIGSVVQIGSGANPDR